MSASVPSLFLPLLAAAALLSGVSAVNAQGNSVIRIVTPDGRVTFTDLTGAGGAVDAPAVTPARSASEADRFANFPFALRQAATRHPVTLYTSNGCQPCNRGRQMLLGRGIPFEEKTISNEDDAEAFAKLGGGGQVPYLTVGAQAVSGYSESEWTRLLNNAGYPPNSQLPRTYQAMAPQPLAPRTAPPPTTDGASPASSTEAAPAEAPPVPVAPPTAPGGIRF